MAFRGMPARLSDLIADTITGGLITGGTYRSRESGERLEINTGAASQISFYSGATSETEPSFVQADDSWRGNPNVPNLITTGGRRAGHTDTRPSVTLLTNSVGSRTEIEGQIVRLTGNSGGTATGAKYAVFEANTTAQENPFAEMSANFNGGTFGQVLVTPGAVAITGGLTVNGGAAGQAVVSRVQAGAGVYASPVGGYKQIYGANVVVPPDALSAHVTGRAIARGTGETDVTWTLTSGAGITLDSTYLYNASDAALSLSATLVGIVAVTPGQTLDLRIYGASAGAPLNAYQGSFSVTFLK